MIEGNYIRTENGRIGRILFVDEEFCKIYYDDGKQTSSIPLHSKYRIAPYTEKGLISLIEPMDLLYVDIDNNYEGGIIIPRIPETQNEVDNFKSYIECGYWILKGIMTHERLEDQVYKVNE